MEREFDRDFRRRSTSRVLNQKAHPAMKDAEIWRIANDMIRDYGAEAENYARSRADTLRQQGIPNGAEDWIRVAEAIAELKRHPPDDDEAVN
jgi:hypothetical protein